MSINRRAPASSAAVGPIMVAVDGSPESAAALRWAAERARGRNETLRIVTAYDPPLNSYRGVDIDGVEWKLARRDARLQAEQVVDEVFGHHDVDHIVALGPIERVLIDYSQSASMIVIGTRSTRGWLRRLRRSVTNRLTGAVGCPVVSISDDGAGVPPALDERRAVAA